MEWISVDEKLPRIFFPGDQRAAFTRGRTVNIEKNRKRGSFFMP